MKTATTTTAVPAATSDASGAHDEASTLSGAANPIAQASKAFRESAAAPAAPAKPAATATTGAPPETAAAADATATADDATTADQPRNADGTFATKEGEDTAAAETDAATVAEADAEAVTDETTATDAEPRIFKLAGDPQRGEEDIELDVTGLPEEVVKRLELNETRGMRRREFNQAMEKVTKVEADFVEFETMLKLNPEGVVLDHMAPASRLKVGAAILLEHWDDLAPTIQALWEDPGARKLALSELRDGARSVSQSVAQQIETNRKASAIRRAIETTIPDKADPSDAVAYRAAAHALIVQKLNAGEAVSPDAVPTLLASLVQRYGFDAEVETAKPKVPVRPKLAVAGKPAQQNTTTRQTTQTATAGKGGTQTVSTMSPERFRQTTEARQAARQVAPQGAGALPVKKPGPPETATIAEASAFLRGGKARR